MSQEDLMAMLEDPGVPMVAPDDPRNSAPLAFKPGETPRPELPASPMKAAASANGAGSAVKNGPDPSWLPVDLGPALRDEVARVTPTILRCEDGRCLLYRGRVNGIHGDSGDGKTWTAYIATAQEIAVGNHVLWIDFEDNESVLVERLRDVLRASVDAIKERLCYFHPNAPFEDEELAFVEGEARRRHATLLVLDSLGEAFGVEGLDEDRDAEVGPWFRRVARRLADAGPAVLLIDHSTKAKDNPLFPSGSKRKRAAITGASYLLQAPEPLTREHGGRLRLTCAKDRHGHFRRGDPVANIEMKVAERTYVRVFSAEAPENTSDESRLEFLAASAVQVVKAAGEELSKAELEERLKGKAATKRAAIAFAVRRGALSMRKDGSAHLHAYVRDFPGSSPSGESR